MLHFDYSEDLLYWIISTSNMVQRVMNDALIPIGMTFRQAEVLGWLALEGRPISQAELARRMQVAAPTLGGIVDRMERDGWIVREPCPEDRRKILLKPTERVEPVWEQMLSIGLQVRDRATVGFSAEQVAGLMKSLAAFQENLRKDEVDAQDVS